MGGGGSGISELFIFLKCEKFSTSLSGEGGWGMGLPELFCMKKLEVTEPRGGRVRQVQSMSKLFEIFF